jgi:hypothetical protein
MVDEKKKKKKRVLKCEVVEVKVELDNVEQQM